MTREKKKIPHAEQWDNSSIDFENWSNEQYMSKTHQCPLCGDITLKTNCRTLQRCQHLVCLHCLDRIENGDCCFCWTDHPINIRYANKVRRLKLKKRRRKREKSRYLKHFHKL